MNLNKPYCIIMLFITNLFFTKEINAGLIPEEIYKDSYSWLKDYIDFPKTEQLINDKKNMCAVKNEFTLWLYIVLKEHFMPDFGFIDTNLLFSPPNYYQTKSWRSDDLVYLTYSIEGNEIQISQTGGYYGNVFISIRQNTPVEITELLKLGVEDVNIVYKNEKYIILVVKKNKVISFANNMQILPNGWFDNYSRAFCGKLNEKLVKTCAKELLLARVKEREIIINNFNDFERRINMDVSLSDSIRNVKIENYINRIKHMFSQN